MASFKLVYVSLICLPIFIASSGVLQQCVPLRNGPLAKCSLSGYNTTFPLPKYLSKRSLAGIEEMANYVMNRVVQNCSVGGIGETMVCSIIAPYCKETTSSQILPCKRVCSEYLKRCVNFIPDFAIDIMIAMCSLLENKTASEGTCYEPPDFHKHYNSTSLGPLERSCSPVIIPICKGFGYNHTIITTKRQQKIYKNLYGKNYSVNAEATQPAKDSTLDFVLNHLKNFSKCTHYFLKVYCSELVPPCFPDKGISFYTACKDDCKTVASLCPGLEKTRLKYFMYCERLAFGEPYKGFCKHTAWPPPMKWLDIYKDSPTKAPKPKGGVSGGVIAAVIIIPAVLVGSFIAVVFFYKKRQLTGQGYSRQEDDKADLVI